MELFFLLTVYIHCSFMAQQETQINLVRVCSIQYNVSCFSTLFLFAGSRESYESEKVLGRLFRSVVRDIKEDRISKLQYPNATWDLTYSLVRKKFHWCVLYLCTCD